MCGVSQVELWISLSRILRISVIWTIPLFLETNRFWRGLFYRCCYLLYVLDPMWWWHSYAFVEKTTCSTCRFSPCDISEVSQSGLLALRKFILGKSKCILRADSEHDWGRYSGEGRTKLLVRSICVPRQWAVSSYSVLNWWCLHIFTVLKLYIWFIISFSFAIHFPTLWMFVLISLMNCASIMYNVSAVPVIDCVGISCSVNNNWYYCYIMCSGFCMVV